MFAGRRLLVVSRQARETLAPLLIDYTGLYYGTIMSSAAPASTSLHYALPLGNQASPLALR